MYNLLLYIYLFGVAVASLFSTKVKKMWKGEREAIRVIKEKLDPTAKYAWVHAASLGEFEQGRPIIERIRKEHPEYKILLTFFSPSGYEVRKNYEGADIVCYLPLDTYSNAHRFLNAIHPEVAFFIKYEFWYNYLHILNKRGVPVYSVSSIFRPNQIFFRWYGKQYSRVLKCFTHFFVQNEQSKELLASIGLDNVTVTGDTRFDRVLEIQASPMPQEAADKISGFLGSNAYEQKVFIAGSSWQPDEEIFIPYFKNKPNWKLIIAPHVIGEDHLEFISQLCEKNNRRMVRFTQLGNEPLPPATDGKGDVLVIDCFGLLSSIYKYGNVTYVGGGFGVGIHNVLEAAVWNVPVIFGPNHERFQEAMQLKETGGGLAIEDDYDFQTVMQKLEYPFEIAKASKAAGDYVRSKAGATQAVLDGVKL